MRRNAAGWRRRLVSKLPICMRSWRSRSRSISATRELAGRWETLGLGQRRAVLEDRGLAVPGEIGGGLAGTRRGVQIGRHAARRLRGAQQPPRLRLADRDVAGRQVGEHGRAGQRGLRTGRHRDPDVLADLGMHDQARHVLGREQQVGAERRGQRRRWRSRRPPSRRPPRNAAARRIRGSWADAPSAPRRAACRDGSPARSCTALRHGAAARRPAAAAADRPTPRPGPRPRASTASSSVDWCSRSLIA